MCVTYKYWKKTTQIRKTQVDASTLLQTKNTLNLIQCIKNKTKILLFHIFNKNKN